jgi:hypothetical protein
MSELTIVQQILSSGLEGAGLCFLLVLSYKVYKMKISTRSKCCGDNLTISTDNNGGEEITNDV